MVSWIWCVYICLIYPNEWTRTEKSFISQPTIFPDSKHPLHAQLEVLDTAGAEQFTSLNEVYIKVPTSFNTICKSSDNSHQSGRGFVLVFRSKFMPTRVCFVWITLTAWHRKQVYKKWTTCGIRLLGSKGPMWCVVENSSPREDVAYISDAQRIPIVVVGTKLDLVNEREVHRSTIQNLSSQWHLPFYETSAKRNWHATEVFEELLRQMRTCYPGPDPHRKKKKRASGCVVM